MKHKLVYLAIAANFLTIGWFLGLADPAHNAYASDPDIVDMRQVRDFEVTETGIMLNMGDGTGYYRERGIYD